MHADGVAAQRTTRRTTRALAALAALAAAAAGCGAPQKPGHHGAKTEGLSVAIYTDDAPSGAVAVPAPTSPAASALIEDRRYLELERGTVEVVLDGVADTIDASTLLVESLSDPGGFVMRGCDVAASLGGGAGLAGVLATQIGQPVTLRVGALELAGVLRAVDGDAVALAGEHGVERVDLAAVESVILPPGAAQDRIRDHGIRCTLDVRRPGRHLVQLAYAAVGLSFTADYLLEAELGADGTGTARLVPTFTIDNRAELRGAAARVSLLAGVMNAEGEPPLPVWSGELDIAPGRVRVGAPRTAAAASDTDTDEAEAAPARLEYVYRGAIFDGTMATMDPYWGGASTSEVLAQLIVGGERATTLPAGRVMATILLAGEATPRRVIARLIERADADEDEPARIDLWSVADVTGQRHLTQLQSLDRGLIERIDMSISNATANPVVVWIDEPLRRPGKSRLVRKWPKPTRVTQKDVRFRIEVAPGAVGRAAFDVEYRW